MGRRGATVEKVTMTLPADVMGELRDLAPPEGLSGFVAGAIRERLARVRLDDALAAGFGAWSDNDDPALTSSETVSRHVHDLRRKDDDMRSRFLTVRRGRPDSV